MRGHAQTARALVTLAPLILLLGANCQLERNNPYDRHGTNPMLDAGRADGAAPPLDRGRPPD